MHLHLLQMDTQRLHYINDLHSFRYGYRTGVKNINVMLISTTFQERAQIFYLHILVYGKKTSNRLQQIRMLFQKVSCLHLLKKKPPKQKSKQRVENIIVYV